MSYSSSLPHICLQMQPCLMFPVRKSQDPRVCVCAYVGGQVGWYLGDGFEMKRVGMEVWGEATSKMRGNRIPLLRQSRPWSSETKETWSTAWPWTPCIPPLSGSIQLFTHSTLSCPIVRQCFSKLKVCSQFLKKACCGLSVCFQYFVSVCLPFLCGYISGKSGPF